MAEEGRSRDLKKAAEVTSHERLWINANYRYLYILSYIAGGSSFLQGYLSWCGQFSYVFILHNLWLKQITDRFYLFKKEWNIFGKKTKKQNCTYIMNACCFISKHFDRISSCLICCEIFAKYAISFMLFRNAGRYLYLGPVPAMWIFKLW